MVKNPSKIDPWDPLEPLLEPRPFLRQFLAPFWTPKGTPKSIKNLSFFHHNFEALFRTSFWCSWPPFRPPKHLQKETQKGSKTEHRKSSILLLFTALWPHSRVMKIIIFGPFLVPFSKYPFWTSFWSILDHFGDFWTPLGTQKAPQKRHQKKTPKKS